MAIEVLLTANVEGLGAEGDVVNVAEGYARNYLLPKNLAAPVTEATKRKIAKIRRERDERREADMAAARALAARLEKASVTINVKAGENDQMYGSVSNADIAASLKQQGIEIDRHLIVLDAPLKELGVFNVKVKVHPEVEGTVRVWIVKE